MENAYWKDHVRQRAFPKRTLSTKLNCEGFHAVHSGILNTYSILERNAHYIFDQYILFFTIFLPKELRKTAHKVVT